MLGTANDRPHRRAERLEPTAPCPPSTLMPLSAPPPSLDRPAEYVRIRDGDQREEQPGARHRTAWGHHQRLRADTAGAHPPTGKFWNAICSAQPRYSVKSAAEASQTLCGSPVTSVTTTIGSRVTAHTFDTDYTQPSRRSPAPDASTHRGQRSAEFRPTRQAPHPSPRHRRR